MDYPYQDYENRKHYEAALNDLAVMFKIPTKQMRNDFKLQLIQDKIIIGSSMELTDDQLKEYADKISIYYSRMENTPPPERGLVLKNILKIQLKDA